MRDKLMTALLMAAFVLPARAGDCATGELGDRVRKGADVYLGENHGSVEIPALVRCLIEVALSAKPRRLYVSLEQQPAAREPSNEVWRGTDGRASEAMWELTQYVLQQEKAGRLELHQQLPGSVMLEPGQSLPPHDQALTERNMGTPLREFAAHGQLIALSGMLHSAREPLHGLPYQPAGAYAGPDVIHVAVQAVHGGTVWNCLDGKCAEHAQASMEAMAASPGSLTDGAWLGHDHIFWLDRFTASPPRYPALRLRPAGG